MGLMGRADDDRFAEVYQRCGRSVWRYCARRVAPHAVDDAVAETFLVIWRRIDEVPAGDAELAWVYAVAYRVVGQAWRAESRRRRLHQRIARVGRATSSDLIEDSLTQDQRRSVLGALARLGETDAEALRLAIWEQLSPAEVGTVLGIRPDTARQRLSRARRRFAREYEKLGSGHLSGATAAEEGTCDH